VPFQLTSPSGEASPRGTPCDVPGNVRRVPAQWVRPAGTAPCYARFLDRQIGHQLRAK
jgi:hypothetical protein